MLVELPSSAADAPHPEQSPEQALWARRDEPAIRKQLTEQHLEYATAMAARAYARRGTDEIPFEDYLQWARMGLMEAIDRYDPERGAMFSTYAFPRMQGAILNGLSVASERQQQVAFKRELVQQRRESLGSVSAGTEKSLVDTLAELADVAVGLAIGFILEDSGMVEQPEALSPDVGFERLAMRQLQDRILRRLDELKPQERVVLRGHYLQHERFDEIAARLKLTKGRVSQIHKAGIERLRALLREDLHGSFEA